MRRFGPVLLLALLVGTSCVKDVILDAEETPQVVVACILSDDPVQELRLSFTKGASRKEAPPLTEAEAVLTDLSVPEEVGRFSRGEDGVWRLDYAAKPGHRYRLDVTVPGYDPLWAEDTMPGKLWFYVRHIYWLTHALESPTGYLHGEFIPEDATKGSEISWGLDWPAWMLGDPWWKDGEGLPLGETYFCVAKLKDPVWIYAMNYNPVTGRREIAEEICMDYAGVDDFNLTGETYAPPQWESELPYPVKPEYAALLADTHTKALYPWLEGRPLHHRYLRLLPREIEIKQNRNDFRALAMTVSGSFRGKYHCPDNFLTHHYHPDRIGLIDYLQDEEGYLCCVAVSEELDKYLKDARQNQEILASTDLSTIYVRDNLYTDIRSSKGLPGLGVFGCRVERRFMWSGEGRYIDYDRSDEPGSFQDVADWFFRMNEKDYKELINTVN